METKHLKTILVVKEPLKIYWIPFGKGSSTLKPLIPNIYPLFKLYKKPLLSQTLEKGPHSHPPSGTSCMFLQGQLAFASALPTPFGKGLYLWDTWAMPQTPTNKKKHMLNLCGETDCIWYHTLALPKVISKKKSLKDYCTLTPFGKGSCRSMWPLHFCCFTPFGKGPLWWHWAIPWNQNKAHETIHK